MELTYILTRDDIEESLLCLDWKREGVLKAINSVVLTLIVIYSFGLYVLDTDKIFAFQIAFVAMILLFLVTYAPMVMRKYRSSKIIDNENLYKISLSSENIDCIFESNNVYTIKKIDGMYCIPKNAINEEEEKFVRELILENNSNFIKVKIRR